MLEQLDRSSDEPLYAQVAAILRGDITSGTKPPGTAIPSEQVLQNSFGVARSVIRQALDLLSTEGLVLRERGRGTVVLPPNQYRREASQAGGLSEQIAAGGGQLSTRIVSLGVDTAPADKIEVLDTEDSWRLERVRSVDGQPLIHMITWIDRALLPKLTAETLGGNSLHAWMRDQGLHPQGGPRQLHAVAAGSQTAGHLDVPVGSPVTLLEGVTRDHRGHTLEAFSAWHHPTTVFDLDAQVGQSVRNSRAQELLDELRTLLAK